MTTSGFKNTRVDCNHSGKMLCPMALRRTGIPEAYSLSRLQQRQTLGTAVKNLHPISDCSNTWLLHFSFWLPANGCTGKQQVMAPAFGSLPHMWQTPGGVPASWLQPGIALTVDNLGSKTSRWKIALSFPLSNSFKISKSLLKKKKMCF